MDQREGAAALPPGNRDMTFEEKRRLSHALGALPGDRLGRVLDIVRESQPVDEARAAWGWRSSVTESVCRSLAAPSQLGPRRGTMHALELVDEAFPLGLQPDAVCSPLTCRAALRQQNAFPWNPVMLLAAG